MRLEKRASFGWGPTAAGSANPRNGIAVHFDGNNQGLANKSHSACRTYWKATRKFHMGPEREWLDIGYSFGCCPHGVIFEGRGLNHQQAAQPGGNSTWYSCTFMSGPSESPPMAQLVAFREFRSWLRGKGVAAAMRGHRDFVSTDCPGSILYRMVRDGSLATKPVPAPPAPTPTTEEDMPQGQLASGQEAITAISLKKGAYGGIGFLADNGVQALPPASIRVAVHDAKGWHVTKGVLVDSSKPKPVIHFSDSADGVSVQREDDGAVAVGWDVS